MKSGFLSSSRLSETRLNFQIIILLISWDTVSNQQSFSFVPGAATKPIKSSGQHNQLNIKIYTRMVLSFYRSSVDHIVIDQATILSNYQMRSAYFLTQSNSWALPWILNTSFLYSAVVPPAASPHLKIFVTLLHSKGF